MVVVLTGEQIDMILKLFPEQPANRSLEYLATYLKYIKDNQKEQPSIDLDEIPF